MSRNIFFIKTNPNGGIHGIFAKKTLEICLSEVKFQDNSSRYLNHIKYIVPVCLI